MAFITKRNESKYYHVVFWVGTRPNRKKVFRSTRTTDREKAQAIADAIDAIQQGRSQQDRIVSLLEEAGEQQVPDSRIPVGETWSLFERQPLKRNRSPRTMRSKQNNVRKWEKWMTRRHPYVKYLGEVTDRMAWDYMNSQFSDHSGVTWNNNLSSLRSVFDIIRVPAGLSRNVWEAVPRRDPQSIRRKPIPADKVRELLKVARSGDVELKDRSFWPVAISLAYHTGLRWGDVVTLECEEINWDEGVLELIPGKTRRRREEKITPWIHNDFKNELKKLVELRGGSGPVWPILDSAYKSSENWPHQEWRALCSKVQLKVSRPPKKGEQRKKDVLVHTFHSLRHTYVTALLDAGVDPRDVQLVVGHGSPVMTEHYNHSKSVWQRVAAKSVSLQQR